MSYNCQVSTPEEYIIKMLEYVGYSSNIFGKKVLENSFGRGNILVEIVKRYIEDGIRQGKSLKRISERLRKDIIGYEVDQKCVEECRRKLNGLVHEFGIHEVKWNLHEEDYLESRCGKVDFVIGNPPYITYHDLEKSVRENLKLVYSSCKFGRFDYYYPFVEKSLNQLKSGGKLVYLIPFNIFRNKSADILRKVIKPYLTEIYDFSEKNVFPEVMISSTIVVCEKKNNDSFIRYINENSAKNLIIKKNILGEKWLFETEKRLDERFGDYFLVSNSVATLLNEAFIISDYDMKDNNFIYINNFKIENEVLREAVSPRSLKSGKNKLIIFPYKNNSGKICRYNENEFEDSFPEAAKYLNSFREKLEKRKSAKNVRWFEYGRSQAISVVKKSKLVMPMIITSK